MRMRKKRWQVYSIVDSGNPLFVASFDLRADAQRLIDRQEDAYNVMGRDKYVRRPRFVLLDSREQTLETATQTARRLREMDKIETRNAQKIEAWMSRKERTAP